MTTAANERIQDLDVAPGGTPEPADPTERPDVDPAHEPEEDDSDPNPPADRR